MANSSALIFAEFTWIVCIALPRKVEFRAFRRACTGSPEAALGRGRECRK